MLISELMDKWLENHIKTRVKYHTYCMYRDMVNTHFKTFFNNIELENIDRKDIENFIVQKTTFGNLITSKGLCGRSVNRMIVVLTNIFDYGVKFGYININPCTNVRRIREEEKEIEVFNKDELSKLYSYCFDHIKETIGIILALNTGMRIGEIVSLKWSDIDFDKNNIVIHSTKCYLKNDEEKYINWEDKPKTKNSKRIIPLSEGIMNILKNIEHDSDYVLTNKKGYCYSVRAYQHVFERLLDKIKIKHRGFHALRHTFATISIEIGGDVKTVSELLGHKNSLITLNLYVHSYMEQKRFLINNLLSEYSSNI